METDNPAVWECRRGQLQEMVFTISEQCAMFKELRQKLTRSTQQGLAQ